MGGDGDTAEYPGPPLIGVPAIDAALAGLRDLDELPVSAHPARLLAAHGVLVDTLNADPLDPSAGARLQGSPDGTG